MITLRLLRTQIAVKNMYSLLKYDTSNTLAPPSLAAEMNKLYM